MSNASKQFKRTDEQAARIRTRTTDGKEARRQLLCDAITFLNKPGSTSKFFATFGDVRRQLKIEGKTRDELINACLDRLAAL